MRKTYDMHIQLYTDKILLFKMYLRNTNCRDSFIGQPLYILYIYIYIYISDLFRERMREVNGCLKFSRRKNLKHLQPSVFRILQNILLTTSAIIM